MALGFEQENIRKHDKTSRTNRLRARILNLSLDHLRSTEVLKYISDVIKAAR